MRVDGQKTIMVLTIILVILGFIMAVSYFTPNDATYAGIEAYTIALEDGELNPNAPDLPNCAEDIIVSSHFGSIQSVTFTCVDEDARTIFRDEIESGFEWNILIFDQIRVELKKPDSVE